MVLSDERLRRPIVTRARAPRQVYNAKVGMDALIVTPISQARAAWIPPARPPERGWFRQLSVTPLSARPRRSSALAAPLVSSSHFSQIVNLAREIGFQWLVSFWSFLLRCLVFGVWCLGVVAELTRITLNFYAHFFVDFWQGMRLSHYYSD